MRPGNGQRSGSTVLLDEYFAESDDRFVAELLAVSESGKLAGLANGSVTVRYGDTLVLVTACASNTPREGVDFLPLTVDYEERLYAAGKIPGSFFRPRRQAS